MNESSTVSLGLVLAIVGPLVSLLLFGNIFFIKKLVDKISSISEEIPRLANAIATMGATINGLDRRHIETATEVRALKRLDSRISYLEGILRKVEEDGEEFDDA